MKLMGSEMLSAEHRHVFRSGSMFRHWKKSLRASREEIEDVEMSFEREKEKILEVLEGEHEALFSIRSPAVCSWNPVQKGFFHASLLELGVHF